MGIREKTRARGPRMTMKTRLRVLVGDHDVEPIPLEDDEEAVRGLSTAGVDAEDANEHHLQAVLSAAALKQQALHAPRNTRSHAHRDDAKASSSLNVAIPVPDATGVADNFEELYPRGVFKEPVTMIRFSDTVEESIQDGLAGDNASYFMDDPDRIWLDRYISRKAKGKGKEKEREDEGAPAKITEDEFELVMGMFERHIARSNMHLDVDFRRENLPKFSEFEPHFRNISQYDFAAMKLPAWLPPPAQLVRIAQAIYQHWCMRRGRRSGSNLAPTLLMDETADNENDSYLCFRRREVKLPRKTRKQDQVTVDKMIRLQTTLNKGLELAQCIVDRERRKKEAYMAHRALLEARVTVVTLKRKHSEVLALDDDEVLFDRERRKRARVEPTSAASAPAPAPAVLPPTKSSARATRNVLERRATSSTPPVRVLPDIVNRVVQRQKEVAAAVDHELAKRREADAGFEDALDIAFQPPPVSLPMRKFRAVEDDGSSRSGSAVSRLRVGRGGRVGMDRMAPRQPHSSLFAGPAFTGEPLDDRLVRISSLWKFDADVPAPSNVDQETGRFLVDEWDASLLKGRVGLFTEADVAEALRIEQTVLPQRPTVTTAASSSAVPTVIPAAPEPTLPRISQLSTAARQRDIRPSPPAIVAPPAVPAVPSPSPTTAVAPPERTATPSFAPAPPAPVPTPIRPPSVAPVAAHLPPPPQVPSTPRPLTPAPVNIARSGTPAVPMLPLRPVSNVGPRLAPTPTPKPYNVPLPLPSTPNMNGHQHQNVVNGMDGGMMVNGHNGMTNGMMMAANGHHPAMNGHAHAGVMAGMGMAMANGMRPMSRATTSTTPNGFPAGSMQAHMGVNGDASGSQQQRVPSPVRQKAPGANSMINMAQYNAWKNSMMPPPPQPMNGAVTYAAQAQPGGAQHMYYASPHANSGLEPAQMTQLLQAFRPQQYAQHPQQQQQQQPQHHQHQQHQQQHQHQQHQHQQQQQHPQLVQQMPQQMVYKTPQGVRLMNPNQAQAAYYYAQQQQQHQQAQQQLAFMNMAAANGMAGVGVVPMQQHMVQGQPMMMAANGQGLVYAPMQQQQVVQQQPQQPQASGSQPNGAPVPAH